MNPHFLFNALNAIQGYIADGNKEAANRYLSRFSRLVRAALQHSRLTKLPLEDDLRNLQNYLELEQIRFHEKFDYRTTVAEDIDPVATTLPPMLVQPFLENAIIHGIANKEGKGQIDLDFRLEGSNLLVTVMDNGIGIEQSRRLKKEAGSEHQSVGMSITARRLEMLGGEGGKVEVEELKDEEGQAAGTRVRVRIPIGD
jgi:LytS/YehU family sensor histidine kinase